MHQNFLGHAFNTADARAIGIVRENIAQKFFGIDHKREPQRILLAHSSYQRREGLVGRRAIHHGQLANNGEMVQIYDFTPLHACLRACASVYMVVGLLWAQCALSDNQEAVCRATLLQVGHQKGEVTVVLGGEGEVGKGQGPTT